ncbi:VRR-NUC domain-containing protein [Pseudomonas sp. Gutcm_11s]|uniref:VRR-NUC domain-containing protein n=1 Tax=Pseudomonas sp. Gutcm_11s TaxID=3026088 RepID=UPI00235E1839|nr:VRR-NUC domain-containing protein [Pseudomonas sp. Gutcm_11s]MDD0842034.1 VRR-NUC domain-containing protein [Pseudomonas sp. Gutcm_11s]
MLASLDSPLYYLDNFRTALAWISERYGDLLDAEELAFLQQFAELPQASQALLVRLIMRKGLHFRASKLSYAEIGDIASAAEPLLQQGWLIEDARLELAELFALLRKDELLSSFAELAPIRGLKKDEQLQVLLPSYMQAQAFAHWCPQLDRLFSLTIGPLCDRLRLLFFGNLAQDWSEFVLAELGVYRYESVPIGAESRGFRSRKDLDDYLHLQHCRELFEAGLSIAEVLLELGEFASENPHLTRRHAKLLFHLGQQLEREVELERAAALYAVSSHAEARQRRVRVLEKLGELQQAHDLATTALLTPRNDAEAQALERALPRLQRLLGLPKQPRKPPAEAGLIELELPQPLELSVEWAVQQHLHDEQAPAFYVENTLVCSLFGLLCWEAIFAPLPGAFFHPFHAGPVDLHDADFRRRRAELFERCLARLDDGSHAEAIRTTYTAKHGIVSPFVHWAVLTPELLEIALHCLPPAHLRAWFERLLGDIRANRAGMPDLIQFWPAERRYRMIEVKGPGDRLQDNQKRWLAFCAEHGMPVDVCYVRWSATA